MEQIRVVVVDDHMNMVQLISKIVGEDSELCVVGTAQDGEAAIELIKETEPDVVLLDIVMPKADGLSVMDRINQEMPAQLHPFFLVVSSVSSGSVMEEAFHLGASYYMIKPFDPVALIQRIKMLVNGRQHNFPTVEIIEPYETVRKIERRELENVVTDLLHQIGVPSHIKGYQYLREAIILALADDGKLDAAMNKLYPEVAVKFESTVSRVERGMRHAIELAWDRGDMNTINALFGYSISGKRGRPTNTEFIALIADKLRLEYC